MPKVNLRQSRHVLCAPRSVVAICGDYGLLCFSPLRERAQLSVGEIEKRPTNKIVKSLLSRMGRRQWRPKLLAHLDSCEDIDVENSQSHTCFLRLLHHHQRFSHNHTWRRLHKSSGDMNVRCCEWNRSRLFFFFMSLIFLWRLCRHLSYVMGICWQQTQLKPQIFFLNI